MTLVLRNGRAVCPASGLDATLDILIDGGKIAALGRGLRPRGARLFDADGLVVVPGFIDLHVHLREPGQEHKETIESGARAAARGGFTTICCMPNTSPVNDNVEVTRFILERSRTAAVHVLPIAAVSRGLLGEEMNDLAGLAAAGAVAFSDDGRPVAGARLMRRALEESRRLRTLVIDHCEDIALAGGGVMNEGSLSKRLGLPGIPGAAEEVAAARDIILAGLTGGRLHLAHVSVAGTVRLLREARRRNVRVSAEATPHHLLLTEAACSGRDPRAKVNPPLRGRADVETLLEAVREGLIGVIATDHAPHADEEKAAGFEKAPFGINGLETAVSLLLDRLVREKVIGLKKLVRMMSTTPASLLGLKRKGVLRRGADADLTLLDLGVRTTVDVRSFVSGSRNSPFDGWRLRGAPVATLVNGRVAYPFDGRLPGEGA
jgi:dihydroorotase